MSPPCTAWQVSAFYASALLALAVGAAVGAYFACRLSGTSVGVLGSLTDAERERHKRRRAAAPERELVLTVA